MQPRRSPPRSRAEPEQERDGRLGMLREQIAQAVAEQLCRAEIDWDALEQLGQPSLRIEATLHDATVTHTNTDPTTTSTSTSTSTNTPQTRSSQPRQSRLPVLNHVIDLTHVVSRSAAPTPRHPDDRDSEPADKQACGTIVPARTTRQSSARDGDPAAHGHHAAPRPGLYLPPSSRILPVHGDDDDDDNNNHGNDNHDDDDNDDDDDDEPASVSSPQEPNPRKAISGLRPSRAPVQIVEDTNTRQMQVGDKNFPKRRKVEPTGYALKPSTLDKLIVGIWEQIHSTTTLDPQDLLGQFMPAPPPLTIDDDPAKATTTTTTTANADLELVSSFAVAPGLPVSANNATNFSHKNIFCRKVTQASRTCRSIEVIVQARWVEHFEAHIEASKMTGPALSDTKHRKAALTEACHDFGWTEKELRNKMAVWRGYKEIKDAGGWAALVFAGMGIYRFCKYRIGFDRDSLQRLRNLRPALEVAADTLHPHWRQLLALVDLPTDQVYTGHRHDWVVFPDGSDPVPLHTTYLHWDHNFSFKHIDESVVDEQQWGCDDPRWAPPLTMKKADDFPGGSALMSASGTMTAASSSSSTATATGLATVSLPVCTVCDKEQSDDPRYNACMCFPSLFGCANPAPSPVQVFRTKGRSNGLLALCAFERGAPVGEFVGLVTRGLENVDVMEGCTTPTQYPQGLSSASSSSSSSYSSTPIGATPTTSLLLSTTSLSSSSRASFLAQYHNGHGQRPSVGGGGGGHGGQQHHQYNHLHLQSHSQQQQKQQAGVRYQIWQGRQGNFTRFVNHSCNANAQYQTFTWLGTQRIILVSKGIEAGQEITVDYSDKYWKGLDKKCLCGEKSCRYRGGGS